MAGDLGSAAAQVHRQAESVLHFWFDEVPDDKRFARDMAIDRACEQRFGAARRAVIADPAPWHADGRTILAAVILIDQFSRNIFRDDPRAFAHDDLARALAQAAIDRGFDVAMTAIERQFLYMPFMHSESIGDQGRSVELFRALGLGDSLDFALRHRAQILRFGRFPQRNAALGRATTPEEEAFLNEPGARF